VEEASMQAPASANAISNLPWLLLSSLALEALLVSEFRRGGFADW